MFYSCKLDQAPAKDSLLRPNWLVNARTLPPGCRLNRNTHSAPPVSRPSRNTRAPPPVTPLAPYPPRLMMVNEAAPVAQGAVPREPKGTSNIGVEYFKSGVDDFDEYVDMFEDAVDLATRATTPAEKEKAYWQWLKLRLDKPARAIYKQAKEQVRAIAASDGNRAPTWSELKEALRILLIDPQEEYRWQTKIITIKWDGIESFHVLASRVINAVDKFDRKMDDAYKKREYFTRFRMALPKEPYQDAIDMNVGFDDPSIEKAKLYALRAQLTQQNKGENQFKQVTFASASVPSHFGNVTESDQYVAIAPQSVGPSASAPGHSGAPSASLFGNASMQDNRTSTLESSLAGINTKLENLCVDVRAYDSRIGNLEKDMESVKRGSSQNQNPNPWPPQNQGQWGYPPNYWPPYGGYTAPYRPPSPHRSTSQHNSNQQYRSPNRAHQSNRPPSPRNSQQYQPHAGQQQPPRAQSPNRWGQPSRPQSPNRSGQRGFSPNRSGQNYPPSPGKQNPSTSHPKYQHPGTQGGQFNFDTGDEASGYESEVDPEAEVSRLQAELEQAKAKAKAKRGGN